MKLSEMPRDKVIDENGYLTLPFQRFFSEMTNNFQVFLSDEGYLLPRIDNVANSKRDNVKNTGLAFYDDNTNQLIINVNGVFKKVVTQDL